MIIITMNEKIKERALSILKKMSLDEKIGQLNQIRFQTDENFDVLKQKIEKGEVGSIILASNEFAGNSEERLEKIGLIDELQQTAVEKSPSKIPLIFGRDIIHGHKVVLPLPLAMSASFNFELIKEAYTDIAEEAYSDGVNWTFTPMLDLSRDPRWGRIVEGPGEDPYVGSQLAKAVIEGFQGTKAPYKMAACAKHFIGYGAPDGGRDYHKAEISNYSLHNYYLRAFKAAVDSGVMTVMNSFNEISGQPTASSKYLLTDVLRGELGFEGFVISDWGTVIQLVRQGVADDSKEATCLAINAGLDMDMCDECYINNLKELVLEGKVSEETIDTSVFRILYVKLMIGLFEKPCSPHLKYDIQKHLNIARELAGESMVLLKNKDDILPLDTTESIGLAGPFLNDKRSIIGTWSLDFDLSYSVTIAEGIQKVAQNAFEIDDNSAELFDKCETVILVLGESEHLTGEGAALTNIFLPEEQKALIRKMKEAGKKIVAVITAGRPYALADIEEDCDAILYAWHCGSQTGNAAADIIFGRISPSGRLPVTFPRSGGQIPLYYNCPPAGRDWDGYYDKVHNYRDNQGSPLYPFGYGLSYTSFEYSDIRIEQSSYTLSELQNGVRLCVSVKNTGKYDSKEVVQLYIRDVKASMTRPKRELKAAQKVFIKRGSEVNVEFILNADDFGFYNSQGKFVIESGDFIIYIGENCFTERKVTITIK